MGIEEKAENLIKEGRVKKELETGKRIHFLVEGTDERHSVIFDKETENFTCDCKFGTLREKTCSHILASKIYLLNEEKKPKN